MKPHGFDVARPDGGLWPCEYNQACGGYRFRIACFSYVDIYHVVSPYCGLSHNIKKTHTHTSYDHDYVVTSVGIES